MKANYIIKLIQAFIRRFRGIILLSVGLGAALFLFLQFIFPLVWPGRIERIGLTGHYRANELPNSVLNQVSQGLTKFDQSGNLQPAIASSWESQENGQVWTFHLADNLFWQDGKKLTSQEINYNFEDLTIEKPDRQTIVFKLNTASASFPAILTKPVFKKGLLGMGDWKVKKLSLVGDFVEQLILQDQDRNRMKIRFYPTEQRTKLAFKLGEVDQIQDLLNPEPFDQWPTVKIEKKVNYQRVVVIFFNVQDPLLSDKSIRQALAYGIDKNSFEGERALSPISPDSWAYNSQVKTYQHSPSRSKELLGELPTEMKEKLEVKLTTTPVLLDIAEKIANYWREIGVKTTVQVTSTLPTEYQAFLVMYDIPMDPDQYPTWHSTQQTTNISKYVDPRIDKLLEDGRQELDQEKRRKIYLDFQRFLLEDSPAIFLYHPTSYAIIRE